MIIKMRINAEEKCIKNVEHKLNELGYEIGEIIGRERTVIGIKGDVSKLPIETISTLDGVEEVIRISKPYKLASHEYKLQMNGKQTHSKIRIKDRITGEKRLMIIAGPCAIESKEQLLDIAKYVSEMKKSNYIEPPLLRGGAFKPRSSPYSFQGLGEEGLKYLAEARAKYDLPVVTEVMDPNKVTLVSKYADVLQIGARNMQNFDLLRAVGKTKKPILLKRGISATIEEFLMSAEYILANGNTNVILCLRGIRTYNVSKENFRNDPDLADIIALKRLTHLPLFFDPSHATGDRDAIFTLSMQAIAGGVDGLIIETHSCPDKALCDGKQSIDQKQLQRLFYYADKYRKLYLDTLENKLT
jgi:3-deoxy-7-phosphoheptulonate synthase